MSEAARNGSISTDLSRQSKSFQGVIEASVIGSFLKFLFRPQYSASYSLTYSYTNFILPRTHNTCSHATDLDLVLPSIWDAPSVRQTHGWFSQLFGSCSNDTFLVRPSLIILLQIGASVYTSFPPSLIHFLAWYISLSDRLHSLIIHLLFIFFSRIQVP